MPPPVRNAIATEALAGFLFLAATLAVQARAADLGETPEVPLLESAVRLDGGLDEDAWRMARKIGHLTQREPLEGAEPSEHTEVLLSRDVERLYIGVICYDSRPTGVVGTQMARDADLSIDDSIQIVLDPFLDRRNGYYFQINPAGSRVDGLIANNGDPAKEWDGIWEARATRTDQGWSAEIALPFKTLNFNPNEATWGFNVQRTIKRKQETARWRAARQNIRIAQVSEAGAIVGFAGVRQGRGLDVRPYGSAGVIRDARGAAVRGDTQAGIDLVKNITPNLSATVTVNTDFAEIEVDPRQVNLTRFSLFFPERRTFFLQNASIFQTAGQATQIQPDLVPSFSRRIGLDAGGEPLPILAGLKLAGRAGDWSIGVLDIHTREAREIPGQNFLAARASRNLGRQSVVGALLTHGSPAGDPWPLAGLDGRWARSDLFGSKNLVAEGAVFKTFPGQGEADDGTWAVVGRLDYPNDPLEITLSLKEIGSRFSPGMGFVRRRGIRKGNFELDYFLRPRKWGIRHEHPQLKVETVHRSDGRLLNWQVIVVPANIRTESGDHTELQWYPQYEFLELPFVIRPGIVVPAGRYAVHQYRVILDTASKRKVVYPMKLLSGRVLHGKPQRVADRSPLQAERPPGTPARPEPQRGQAASGKLRHQHLAGTYRLGVLTRPDRRQLLPIRRRLPRGWLERPDTVDAEARERRLLRGEPRATGR